MLPLVRRLCVSSSLLMAAAMPLSAQTPTAANADNGAVLRELSSLREEVREIKTLLQAQQAKLPTGATRTKKLPESLSQDVTLPFLPDQVLGSGQSKFVVVEFADLQCPFCSYFNKNSFPTFKKGFVDTGKVRFMSVDFPLESHPDASRMSLASLCAGEQGKYWEMRDMLMQAGSISSTKLLDEGAAALQMKSLQFNNCLASAARLSTLKMRAESARNAGIYSTPSFVVGQVHGNEIKGVLLVGTMSAEDFGAKINAILTQFEETKHGNQPVSTRTR